MAGRHERRQPENRKPKSGTETRRLLTPEQKRRRRLILWSSIGVAVVAMAGAAYAEMNRPRDPGFNPPPKITPPAERNRVTTLLIGTDTRPGESGGNTDVLIVMSVDYKHKRIEMMSIPRDTKVLFPDGSYNKINAAYNSGGVSLTDSIVENLIGINIPNYAITHFGGLVNIINTIGGISVNVPERMYYNTGDKQYGLINLYPGYQKLTGEQALGFVRFREDALGDIGRTKRQQAFLSALEQALFQPSNITKLPQLIQEFWRTVDTNFSIGSVLKIASGANQLKGFHVITETLPGAYHNPSFPGDASYWIVNPQQAKWVAQQFFYDGIIQPNIILTEQQVNNWTPPLPGQNPTSGSTVTSNTGQGGSNSQSPSNVSTGTSTASTATGSSTSATTTGSSSNSSASSTVPTTAVAPVQMLVTAASANIRSGPGTNYATVGSLLRGNKVTVIGKSGDWDEVPISGGSSGYVASWLLGNP